MNKLKGLINIILDLILPNNQSIKDVENMSQAELLVLIPKALDTNNNRYKALFQYKNSIMRKSIWAIKYNKNGIITKKFANLLYEYILEEISDEILFVNFNNPVLVPIPMHNSDLKNRGYNQSEQIVKEIYKIDNGQNFDISINTLVKNKKTPHQSELKNKSDRLKNLTGCFSIFDESLTNRNIILIDDVITTGTTMTEASKILKKNGAKKVIAFSLAH